MTLHTGKNRRINQRMTNDQTLLARLATKLGSNSILADALGVSWTRLKNWRVARGVPAAYRMRVATLANMHGFRVGADWIDTAKPSKESTNGRTRKGKRPTQAAAQGKRPRAQRRAVSKRPTGRTSPTAP